MVDPARQQFGIMMLTARTDAHIHGRALRSRHIDYLLSQATSTHSPAAVELSDRNHSWAGIHQEAGFLAGVPSMSPISSIWAGGLPDRMVISPSKLAC